MSAPIAPRGRDLMDSSDRQGNDLTLIKGIGPARQQWLGESLGVYTFEDLAKLSADAIESRLKARGHITSRNEIERWISRARERALALDPPSQQDLESANTATRRKANPPTRDGEWKPLASFVVEFQALTDESGAEKRRTAIHHMEADESKTWSGVQGEPICQWMLDQLGEEAQHEAEPEERELRPETWPTAPPVRVEIKRIWAFQPPQTEKPVSIGEAGQPLPGYVRGHEPFALKVSFELIGRAVAEVVRQQIAYDAQLHARNLSTGEHTSLGTTRPATLVEAETSYTALLAEATLQPGIYALQVLVTLQSTPPTIGYLEVPLLQVA